jgi:deazaflavin-dependent oxidoreductase (nitroreductase family)
MDTRMNPILRHLFRAPARLYRWHCGWLLGHRFLLLIHTGHRTGRRYETVLEVMERRPHGPEFIVMSGFGRNAGWLRNIQAAPTARIVIGNQALVVTHRFLDADEAMRVVAAYERRSRLAAPVVRAVLRRLLGWPYDGSDSARRRLVRQLPLLGFRPRRESVSHDGPIG